MLYVLPIHIVDVMVNDILSEDIWALDLADSDDAIWWTWRRCCTAYANSARYFSLLSVKVEALWYSDWRVLYGCRSYPVPHTHSNDPSENEDFSFFFFTGSFRSSRMIVIIKLLLSLLTLVFKVKSPTSSSFPHGVSVDTVFCSSDPLIQRSIRFFFFLSFSLSFYAQNTILNVPALVELVISASTFHA